MALLRDKFAEKENPAHIAELVQQLRKEDASSRDAAREELSWMGVQAEEAIATEMSRVEPGAYRNELEALLRQAESRVGPSSQNLRRQRAMQVLESIGSAEALDALRHLSGESPSLRERADAEGAVRRMEMKASR
ncbi:MAG: hypothetical protein K8T20_04030 [Planctomycetes bacterium]|nr:hypothetical protein [Planctomycetota bacterium]